MHVTIDGYGGDPQKLADENLVRAFLDLCPSAIGMTKIAPPYVCRYVGAKPEDWGVSGFVLIAESHISAHTFPDHGYIWVDVFSCKSFNAEQAVDEIRQRFQLSDLRVHTLPRGLEFPHSVPEAVPLAGSERHGVADSLQDLSDGRPSTEANAAHPLLPS
ncbi:MAG: S-adenosylmethionine decarboxylase [Dehalococcoidia bacterium]|jgi:S-adenosylmethionine decarboxylase